MKRVVVLGTGTGVGKTWVGAELARALSEIDPSLGVLALKPVESGWTENGLGSDALALATSTSPRQRATLRTPRYALSDPVSPHLAARRAGLRIQLPEVLAWVQRQEAEISTTSHDITSHVTIVETAGGVFSPLSDSETNLDLALAFTDSAWLFVAPDALGVLHDLTATIRFLGYTGYLGNWRSSGTQGPPAARDVRQGAPRWVVLSEARSDASTGTNADELRRLGICDVVATLRRNEPADVLPLARAVWDWVRQGERPSG